MADPQPLNRESGHPQEGPVGTAERPAGGPGRGGGMGGPPGAAIVGALRSPSGFNRTFSSLGEPAYRYLWFGMLLQMGAMQMQMMARGFYIYDLTGSASLLGIVTAGSAIPAVTLGLFGGVLADRAEKKRLIQIGQFISFLIAFGVALLIVTDAIIWQHLLIASILQGAVMPLIMPARQAIVPEIVRREQVMNAVALNSMGMSLTTMAAPAVAGLLWNVVGVSGVYFVVSGMYVGAVVLTGMMPKLQRIAAGPGRSANVFGQLREGLGYVFQNRLLLNLLVLAFTTTILSMPIRFILPIFATDVFKTDAGGLGLMLSVMGVGALGGALFIAAVGGIARRGTLLAVSGVVSGALLVAFGAVSWFVPTLVFGLIVLVGLGVVQSGRMTLNNSLLMEYADERYRGRVMSLFTLNMSLMPASVLPVTLLVDWTNAPATIAGMGVALILVSALVFAVSPKLRSAQ
ncbi:MAG: MFS transporter [Chloroflexi bacterium]|nr:MFS transporter [Chloroflexota bacterium]